MRKSYIKFDEAIELLNQGWEIFTDRGFGNAPYTPLFYLLCKGDEQFSIHHSTIKKLISEKIIYGINVSLHNKYRLRNKRVLNE